MGPSGEAVAGLGAILADQDAASADQNAILANQTAILADQDAILASQNALLADQKCHSDEVLGGGEIGNAFLKKLGSDLVVQSSR